MNNGFVIRRTTQCWDRGASSYVVERVRPTGKSIASGYRFAKTALNEAVRFSSAKEAKKVLTSMKRTDPDRDYSDYTIIKG